MKLWFIGAAIIFVNYTVCWHDYDFFFFYIQTRDNWGHAVLQSTVSLVFTQKMYAYLKLKTNLSV